MHSQRKKKEVNYTYSGLNSYFHTVLDRLGIKPVAEDGKSTPTFDHYELKSLRKSVAWHKFQDDIQRRLKHFATDAAAKALQHTGLRNVKSYVNIDKATRGAIVLNPVDI